MTWGKFSGRNGLLTGCAVAAAAAGIIALLSLALPRFLSHGYDQKSLASLGIQAGAVRNEFSGLLAALKSRRELFAKAPLPADPEAYFSLFKKAGLDPQTEGIGLGQADGNLEIWLGNVINLVDRMPADKFKNLKAQGAAFLVRSKASVYLVSLQPLEANGSLLVHFRLLAFIPQFQSSAVLEFHALRPGAKTAFDIDYWDFQEDVSGFEKFFARNKDEFIGQPRQKNEIQTLFFPLRNESGQIIATVTLSSPSLTSRLTDVREDLRLVLFILLAVAASLGLIFLWTSPGFLKNRKPFPAVLIAIVSTGLRFIVLPLSSLAKVQSLPVFSPAVAGFPSLGKLTQSPADLFLTSLLVLGLAACLAVYCRKFLRAVQEKPTKLGNLGLPLAAAALAAGGLLLLQGLLKLVVSNSNLSLIRWTFGGPFLLLQFALLIFLVALLLVLALVFRLVVLYSSNRLISFLLVAVPAGAVLVASGLDRSPSLILFGLGLLSWTFIVSSAPGLLVRREVAVLGLLLAALWMSQSIGVLTTLRTHALLETTLKHTIVSQESWANFLMEQSFPDIDRKEHDIVAFYKNPVPANAEFAHGLWVNSHVARFNWYSSLELRDAEGNLLSRFSLNVPKFYGQQPELGPSDGWAVTRLPMNFIGKEKEFLVGYKDWRDEGRFLGRLILYVSLDPEMLPFLYSANPYFEVLRIDPMPSLSQFDFGCAIYDSDGNPLFNPMKLTSGIAPADMDRLAAGSPGFWSEFLEKETAYDAYLFRDGERYCRLFTPLKTLKARTVEFLRLFFFDLAVAAIVLLIVTLAAGKSRLRRPFWSSFSNRVYAAFLAVALIPLLTYTVFTRNLFDRIFTQRFVEDATIHASYAQSLMEAFLIIQGTEISPYLAPSEDLVLWISSTLSNDVNLYSDRLLLASSRREFFDSGLLPDLLDGETYESLVYGRKPFTTRRTSIGGYSFQTLTVPYVFKSTTLFISLPFPFEQQEVARATREIVEFFVLLSAFFAALVILFSRGIRSMIIVPVRKLLAGTREVSLGNLEVTIDHRSRDEMMTLIDGFNTMIRNLKAREQELAEMSKKVAWTEMARKVAHEIKNPLTPIQLSAEHVLKVFDDRKGDFDRTLKESMSYIIGEVENLRRIAQEFMEISRDTSLHMDPLDLKEVLDETLRPYRKLLSERIRFRVVYGGQDFRCRGDAAKLRAAFRNIITNAIEAISQKGEVSIAVSRVDRRLVVTTRDTGSGMSREIIDRIFDPYFSTKDSGTGLGLPIAKKIIEDHGGTIRVTSEPGKGTTITVEIPAQD